MPAAAKEPRLSPFRLCTKALMNNDEIAQRVRAEQVAAHYEHVPAMIVAPCLGGAFSVWVLAAAVDTQAMYIGFSLIVMISVLRFFCYRGYQQSDAATRRRRIWPMAAIAFSATSGVLWGSAAIFLYPPHDPQYQIYMILVFALIPLAPIAALACYLPTFYAYYIPCATPFVVRLAMQQDRAGLASAALLIMLMAAAITFARKYYFDFFAALRLRLIVERQRDELQAISHSKSAFLAAASHDLRQPMHAITLFAEALEEDLHESSARAKQRGLLEAAHALRSLLDRLLDLSRVDTGGIAARKVRFNLDDLLQRLGREFTPLAHQQGLTLRVATTKLAITSDPDLLEDLLRNLLSNALRYTRKGGIVLGARRRNNGVAVQVTDSGIGMERQYHQRIFDEFFQVGNPERDRDKGLGLGLAMVRRIATLLDASLDLVSIPGSGTTFRLYFPAQMKALVEPPPRNPEHECEPSPRHSILQGKRILFVENDRSIRDGFLALAGSWGCEVVAAENASAALTLIDLDSPPQPPQVMVLDYALEGSSNGIDIAQQIERRLARRIPTIIVTGDTSDTPRRLAASAGYLLACKPLRFGNLKALIARALDA